MSLIGHVLGLDDPSGTWYLFWSGSGSDITELGLLVGMVAWLRRHNCEVHRCWRMGRHRIASTGHMVCRRHHPRGAPKAEDVRALSQSAHGAR